MKIGSVDLAQRVLIVAEIGNNHEGSAEVAEEMVLAAASSGADAVKFQVIVPEELVAPEQSERLALLKRFQLPFEQFLRLADVAHAQGLAVIFTPFATDLVPRLAPYADALKVASGDNTFYPLMDAVVATGRPMIVSTGLLDAEGVEALYAWLAARMGSETSARLALLHCVCAYPAPEDQAQLGAIRWMGARYPCTIGYSDHTVGIDAAVWAVAAGARIVEKHFTLDHNYSTYRDHKLSADPEEFRQMVANIRRVERAAGELGKNIQPSEGPQVTTARRSLAARRDLPCGHVIERRDLMWVRPGDGFPPGQEDHLVGRRLRLPVSRGQRLSPEHVE